MRLIDDDELYNTLFEEIPLAENVSIFHDMIERTPTAYDIDKVVEELESLNTNINKPYPELDFYVKQSKVIEIVCNGGIHNG